MKTLQTHLSIDTPDLAASRSFYRTLLGAEPSLERDDYVRFDVEQPALALGLNAVARPVREPDAIAHAGLRFPDAQGLDEARRRLATAGVPLEEEPDTECCYARLARVWARDPSGVRWELFFDVEPVVEAPSRAGPSTTCCAPTCCAPAPA